MMSTPQLHKTQVSILRSLRHAESERFSALMHQTNHTSDSFKFHLRKLTRLGYVDKLENGKYELTPSGKEFANNLNEQLRTQQKQPKISILMVIPKIDASNTTCYLLQKRARSPFFGYWSEIHGRAKWGEPFEETARYELKRQTGLEAAFSPHAFRRVRDYDKASNELLEDKLFIILKGKDVSGELSNTYDGGTNAWLSLEELRRQEKVFATTIAIIEGLVTDPFYQAQELTYAQEDY